MLSLIGSVLGLVSSVGPGMFKQWMDAKQDQRDKEHELEMQRQIAADKRDEAIITSIGTQNVAVQTTAQTNLNQASKWVVNLSGTVRPIITYAFFAEFVAVHVAVWSGWMTPNDFELLWNSEVQAIFSTIIMFWFGQRLTSKWSK